MAQGGSTRAPPRSTIRSARVRSNRPSPVSSASTVSPGAAPWRKTTRPSCRASASPPWTRASAFRLTFTSRRRAGEILRQLLDHLSDQGPGLVVDVQELDPHARLVHAGSAGLRPGDAAGQLALELAGELEEDVHARSDARAVLRVHEHPPDRRVGAPPAEGGVFGRDADHDLVVHTGGAAR